MRVLVCPTAFKETLSAAAAAEAMTAGVRGARPEASVRMLPLSDGGPGLIEALRGARGGRLDEWRVRGPLDEHVRGRCLWLDAVAVLESADACGLHLLRGQRAPLDAHTLGVGELVARAVAEGAEVVWLGLGGSGSTDGGVGLGRVFGYRFLNARGREIAPGGRELPILDRVVPGQPPAVETVALADVETPLIGPQGAARTFGPQKGATKKQAELLARGLERLAERLECDLGACVADLPGAGAAGGLGAGCVAFLKAKLVPGSEWVMEAVGFDTALRDADVVLTGEGAYDATSRSGKIVGRVLERAEAAGRPALLVCGSVEGEAPWATVALDGGGRVLDRAGLAALVRNAMGRLG